MKYIKGFNEDVGYIRNEVDILYNNYCSFLIDKGFVISMTLHDFGARVVINHKSILPCKVEEVIYDLSQFQNVLMNEYILDYVRIFLSKTNSEIPEMQKISLDDLFDDEYVNSIKDMYFSEIVFLIKIKS